MLHSESTLFLCFLFCPWHSRILGTRVKGCHSVTWYCVCVCVSVCYVREWAFSCAWQLGMIAKGKNGFQYNTQVLKFKNLGGNYIRRQIGLGYNWDTWMYPQAIIQHPCGNVQQALKIRKHSFKTISHLLNNVWCLEFLHIGIKQCLILYLYLSRWSRS